MSTSKTVKRLKPEFRIFLKICLLISSMAFTFIMYSRTLDVFFDGEELGYNLWVLVIGIFSMVSGILFYTVLPKAFD